MKIKTYSDVKKHNLVEDLAEYLTLYLKLL